MDHFRQSNHNDKPWWTRTSSGKFNVRSAWELLRAKEESNEDLKNIWVKGLPFKISFWVDSVDFKSPSSRSYG